MGDESLTRSATLDVGSARGRRLPVHRARLAVVHPPERKGWVELPAETQVLGRDREDGALRHRSVSRRHLELSWDGRRCAHRVADLGSRNGSWLDGRALGSAPAELKDGSVLRLGSVVAVYEAVPESMMDGDDAVDAIFGSSPAIVRLRHHVVQMAPDPSPVLVTGETGVGKEHVVRALHALSGRRGSLVSVNVAELSAQLVESQLFGHVKGAFTGAGQAQGGLFREASGGTLFLDEIGELPLELQPKLLRAVQEQKVRPVGSTQETSVDVRVLAATHRDLEGAVEAGAFRRDLFARISLLELRVPPLVERRADIPGWVDLLHRRWSAERSRVHVPLRFDGRSVEALLLMQWPDNLRGLDRLVHRLALRACDGAPDAEALAALTGDRDDGSPREAEGGRTVPAPERRPAPETAEALSEALARHGGSVRGTARWYGCDRRQVYRWMKRFGIERGGG